MRLAVLLFLCVPLFPAPASAQTLNLGHPAIAREGDSLLARFGVQLGGVDEIASMLENGVSQQFSCEVSLYRVKKYWFDSVLGRSVYTCVLSFDSLKKEFVLQRNGEDSRLRDADLGALLKKAWANISLSLGSWDDLEAGQPYSLQLEASLHQTEVPDWVTRALFFWSWEKGSSTSCRLDFRF